MVKQAIDFANLTIREDISRRGGGIEIDASGLLHTPGARLTAYQNYLGGGMLGSIQFDCNIRDWQNTEIADLVRMTADSLMQYFHGLTNAEASDWDEYAGTDYDDVQKRSGSAY